MPSSTFQPVAASGRHKCHARDLLLGGASHFRTKGRRYAIWSPFARFSFCCPSLCQASLFSAAVSISMVRKREFNSTSHGKPPDDRTANCTSSGTYVNSKGEAVKQPENCSAAPQGATANAVMEVIASAMGGAVHVLTMAEWLSGFDLKALVSQSHCQCHDAERENYIRE